MCAGVTSNKTLLTILQQKLRDTANGLKIRPEDFPRILLEMGFSEVEHRGETGDGGTRIPFMVKVVPKFRLGFRRPVDIYRKRAQ